MINIPFSTRRASRLVATFWTAYFLAIAPALAIFNGTVDDTDVFASTVQLQNDSGGSCSGVIVYPHVVMTAAHCFILGGLNGWRVIGVRSGTSTVRNVSQIIVNPGYKNSIKGTLYDGAAVILDKPFDIPPGRHLGEFIDLRAVYENWGEGVRLTKVDDHRIKVLVPDDWTYYASLIGSFRGLEGSTVGFGSTTECSSDRSTCTNDHLRRFSKVAIAPDFLDCGSVFIYCMDLSQGTGMPQPGDSGGPLLLDADGTPTIVALVAQATSDKAKMLYSSIYLHTGIMIKAAILSGDLPSQYVPSLPVGWLGVKLEEVDQGVRLLNLTDVAKNMGLKEGEIVTAFNGERIKFGNDFRRKVRSNGGVKVRLGVLRSDDKTIEVTPLALHLRRPAAQSILGLTLEEFTEEKRVKYGLDGKDDGVLVTAVDPLSAAGKLGLKEGDVILEAIPLAQMKNPESVAQMVDVVRDFGGKGIALRFKDKDNRVAVAALPFTGDEGSISKEDIMQQEAAVVWSTIKSTDGFRPVLKKFSELYSATTFAQEALSKLSEETGSALQNSTWLGLESESVSADIAAAVGLVQKHGIFIKDVLRNSPAAKAGVLAGDVVLMFNGNRVDTRQDLIHNLVSVQKGSSIDLRIWRNSKPLDVFLKAVPRAQDLVNIELYD